MQFTKKSNHSWYNNKKSRKRWLFILFFFFELPWSNIVFDEIWSRQKLTTSFGNLPYGYNKYQQHVVSINKTGFFCLSSITLYTFVNFTNVHSNKEKKIWVRACVHRAVTCSNQIKQVFQARQVFPTISNRNVRAGKLIDVHRINISIHLVAVPSQNWFSSIFLFVLTFASMI